MTFRIPEEKPTVLVTLEDASEHGKLEGRFQEVCRPIYGYIPADNDRWMPDIMRDAGVRIADESAIVNGHKTLVLESQGNLGTHIVYVDPEAGYLPRMIVCQKEGQDRYGSTEEPIGLQKARGDPKHRKPNSPLRKYSYEVSRISIKNSEGSYYIDAFDTLTTYSYLNKTTFKAREVVSLTNVSLRPKDTELAISQPIPDGTRVHIQNAPAIDCEWRNGQIVKRLDQTAVSTLSDVKFQAKGTSRWTRSWLVILNLALLALAASVFAYRRLKSRDELASR